MCAHSQPQKTEESSRKEAELQNSRLQIGVMKRLLDDSSEEKEVMYQVFNHELDKFFNDAQLPRDESSDTGSNAGMSARSGSSSGRLGSREGGA